MSKKLTYEYVKEQIESVEGYKLLSKKYVNCGIKLKVQCNKSHNYEVTWNDFQKGCKCLYLFGNKKLTYEYIKEQIENVEGYKLLSNDYKNNHTEDAQADQDGCSECHKQLSFCTDCHFKRNFSGGFSGIRVHRLGYKTMHGLDARIAPAECGNCHQANYCSDCHRRSK